MQLRTSLKSYLLLSLSGPLVLINPVSAKSLATDSAAATLGQLGSQWLNQSGHSEINLTGNTSKTLQGGGALLFPLLSGQQQLLFAQIGGHFGKTGNLLNTGIGQRWFTDQGHWGYNLFHDYHFNNHHQRLSLGLEWQHNNLSIALNGYQPLTDKRLIADTPESKTFERTARGFDLRCQYRLPQHPQLRLNLTGERYLGEIVHNDSIVHNRSAVTVGFDYTPIPLITAGYGFNLDNAQNKAHQLQLTLTYRLGVPLAEQFDPQQVHIAGSSLSNWLNLVQRNHQITLEQLVERPEPKAEVNDGGASPQNTPPEAPETDQLPVQDPVTEDSQSPILQTPEDSVTGSDGQNTPPERPVESEASKATKKAQELEIIKRTKRPPVTEDHVTYFNIETLSDDEFREFLYSGYLQGGDGFVKQIAGISLNMENKDSSYKEHILKEFLLTNNTIYPLHLPSMQKLPAIEDSASRPKATSASLHQLMPATANDTDAATESSTPDISPRNDHVANGTNPATSRFSKLWAKIFQGNSKEIEYLNVEEPHKPYTSENLNNRPLDYLNIDVKE